MKKRSNRSHIKNQAGFDWFVNDSARKQKVKAMKKKDKKEADND